MTISLPIPLAAVVNTYDELVLAIARYCNRSDMEIMIPSFIATCEAEMNRRLALKPVIPMHTVTTLALSDEYIAAPLDMIDVDEMEVADYWQLLSTAPQNMARMKADEAAARTQYLGALGTSVAPPRYYARVGAQFRLFPAPETAFTANLVYWARIPSLTYDSQSNWLLTDHPDAYLSGVMSYAKAYEDDPPARDFWINLFDTVMNKILDAYPTRPDNAPLKADVGLRRRTCFA